MPSSGTKWEYNVVEVAIDVANPLPAIVQGTLQLAGADGWELVSVVNIDLGEGKANLIYHFKRPVG